MFRRKESEIQAAIVRALSQLGFLVIHIANQATRGRQRWAGFLAGAPDLIVINNGKVLFLEVKSSRGKQTASQTKVQRMIEERGFVYRVVRSVDEALIAAGYARE